MGAALITATQINFKYEPIEVAEVVEKVPEPVIETREDYLQKQLAQQLNLPALADTSAPQPQPSVGKVNSPWRWY